MAEQKQILRISSTDNIRYSVLRLLHECLAAVARKGDAQSAIALSKYIFKEFDERDMLLYVETTQYELETRKHVREPIKKGIAFWALLILVQIHLLKNRLFHQRIDMFCAVFYISLAALICIARMAAKFIT